MNSGFELFERVRQHARAAPDRLAYVEAAAADGRAITYRELVEQVETFRLDGQFILRCANRVEFAIAYLALLVAGRAVFPLSIELTEIELANLRRQVEAAQAGEGILGDGMLLATSGTTGLPKIVRRDRMSLDRVAHNMVDAIGMTPDDHVLAAVPLTHSYGVEHGLLAPLYAGSTVHLVDGMDWPIVARALQDATVFPAVPSMIEMIASMHDESFAMPKMRLVYSAGGPLPRGVRDRFAARFGLQVGQVYGMTEIGSVTFNDPSRCPFDAACVGRPMRDVSIRIVGNAGERDGNGEVVIRAPSMLREYVNDSIELIDGHFRTGDLGHIDEHGRLSITGRARLLIDTGGLKINPLEVEGVLVQHPEVAECVVVPVRQSETVERICAVVVARDEFSPPTVESIRSFAKERLAAYKVPRLVLFRDRLPKTATGKVLRHLVEVT
jgi:acyl-coenzyme A synthetase/AMP-(fatty) acid ligase